MSFFQFVVLIVAFSILYKFVIPFLFPSVVGGGLVIHDKRKKDDGDNNSAGQGARTSGEEGDAYVIQASGVPMFGGHRAVARGDLRRRTAESKSNMS